jgi:RimJ/RimL family protein N-acetyltransferase
LAPPWLRRLRGSAARLRRQGLGAELCLRLLDHGFEEPELAEIFAVIDPANVASRTLAVCCGLALCREVTWQGNARVVYATTREEWLTRRRPASHEEGSPC